MKHKTLIGLLIFNFITAAAGGIALIARIAEPPIAWLDGTIFPSYAIPGVILTFIVGGSAMFALYAYGMKQSYSASAAFISGAIMWCWIIGELIVLEQDSALQVLFILTGATVMWLSYNELPRPTNYDKHGTLFG